MPRGREHSRAQAGSAARQGDRKVDMQDRVAEDLLYEVRDGIGLITFNRPAAHNALTFEMYDRLGDICGEVRLGGAVKTSIIIF